MAMNGQLGDCQLTQVSSASASCFYGFSSSPAYSIMLVSERLPFVGVSGQTQTFCLDQAGSGLRQALREGDCFTRHVPYKQFSESDLARQALMGQLGNCKLEKISEDGCADGHSPRMPLYRILFRTREASIRGRFRIQESQYCFDRAGTDLKKVFDSGMCF
jgi:hypothetical protein